MREDWGDFIEREMRRDIESIMEEVNADPSLRDAQAPEELRERLYAQIHEYEKQRVYSQLSDADREYIHLGKVYKKRRKWRKYLILVAAVLALMAVGTVCIGEDENVFRAISTMFGKKEQTEINSKDIEPIMYVEEIEAYEKIKDTYGFTPVKLRYLPKNTSFCEAVFSSEIQSVNMIYEMENGNSIIYVIRPNYREASLGTIIEDEKIQEYKMYVNNVEINLAEYNIEDIGENRWSASFVYQDVQYLLRIKNMVQKDVEKIINNLGF